MRKINVLLLIFVSMVLLSSKILALEAKDLYKKVSPAVVEVVIYQRENGNIKILGSGSGFFIGPQYIVTNYHIIEDAMNEGTFAMVSWNKKYFFKILVAIYDKDLDIAILGINITEHKNYLKRGDSNKVEIGEKVYVIGAPLGFEGSLSEGIISGIRKKDNWKKYFQISNPVSPGSSGSPLVNADGEYIGIVVSSLEEGQNLNFAMSSGYIKYLVENGEFTDVSIGEIEWISEEDKIPAEEKTENETKNKKIKELWDKGYKSLAYLKDYDKAIEYFKLIIDIDGSYSFAYLYCGISYLYKKSYNEAIYYFNQVISNNEKIKISNKLLEYAYYYRGIVYLNKELYYEAITDFSKAIELSPGHANYYTYRGDAYFYQGLYDKAINDFNIALISNPKDIEAYNKRGWAYFDLDDYTQSVDDFKKVIELNNKDADAYCGIAVNYYKLGYINLAKVFYKKAIDIDKRFAGKINLLIKEGYFYTQRELDTINQLLKEMGY